MRRAFISYSLADKDRFIVSRLTSELQKKEMIVKSSQNFYASNIDFTTQKNIDTSNLFIGVITDQSSTFQRVLNEWHYAIERRIPNVLVAEDTVRVANGRHANIIRFNRHNIDDAIRKVNSKIEASRNSTTNEEWVPWVLGGAAIIALLSLLDQD